MYENFPKKSEGDTLGAGHINDLSAVARDVAAGERGAYLLGSGSNVAGLQPFVQYVVEVIDRNQCGTDTTLVEIRSRFFNPSATTENKWELNDEDGPYCLDTSAIELDKSEVMVGDVFVAFFYPQRGHFVPLLFISSSGGGGGGTSCGCPCTCLVGVELGDGVTCCDSHTTLKISIHPFGDFDLVYVSGEVWESAEFIQVCSDGTSTYKWRLTVSGKDFGDVILELVLVTDSGCGALIVEYRNICPWLCLCVNAMELYRFDMCTTGLNSSDLPCHICVNHPGSIAVDPSSLTCGGITFTTTSVGLVELTGWTEECTAGAFSCGTILDDAGGTPLIDINGQHQVETDFVSPVAGLVCGDEWAGVKCFGATLFPDIPACMCTEVTFDCVSLGGDDYEIVLTVGVRVGANSGVEACAGNFELFILGEDRFTFDNTSPTAVADIEAWFNTVHNLTSVTSTCATGTDNITDGTITLTLGVTATADPTNSGDCGLPDCEYGGGNGDVQDCVGSCGVQWTGTVWSVSPACGCSGGLACIDSGSTCGFDVSGLADGSFVGEFRLINCSCF